MIQSYKQRKKLKSQFQNLIKQFVILPIQRIIQKYQIKSTFYLNTPLINLNNMSKSKITQTLSVYKYNPNKPYYTIDQLSCYQAQHKDNGLKFTIKILKKADVDLVEYLKKMKSNSSQFTIKIHQIIHQQQKSELLIVQQSATYGTLKNALKKCKRLDDDDSVAVTKILLNGHIQLLRQGIYWFGDENDIEITDNGIKLSWNNTLVFSHNNQNPFPKILQNIGERKSKNSILQFPKNKMLQDLIKVSRQNASQMSLHPLLKKKQKIFKKKGKEWIGLRQSKIKGEYVQQLSYLGVSKEFGFVRVKYFQKGVLDPQILKIYQTNPSFIKILTYYEENNNLITLSQYSNDGSVQNYIKRLKNASMQLKENQIQFFFYSLIQPLKYIHKSTVVSLNFLHIKNIYILDGIVKIGEPLPMTEILKEILVERADIPDFYHKQFKANPDLRNQKYDTYSLGVLIYKMMFTEYPIFPQQKVHIPTAPSYKPKLKQLLQLFLNVGGSLQQLQQNIQVSEDVKAQVKNNQKALQLGNKIKQPGQHNFVIQQNNSNAKNQITSQLSLHQQQQNQQQVKKKSKLNKLISFFTKRGVDRSRKYQHLEKSNFSSYRQCTVAILILSLYFFAFFIIYVKGAYNLLSHTRLFSKADVTIMGQIQTVIVPNYNEFINVYESYMNTNSISILTNNMMCKIDNKNVYYDFIKPNSPHWYIYLLLSMILMITILILKGIQLCKYSTTTTGYHYYDRTIDGSNSSRFALSSYVMFQLWFGMVLWAFYYLFNIIYNEQHSPCFGGQNWTFLTQSLLTDRMQFTANYFIILLIVFLFGLLSFLQITLFFKKINYDQLCNPIFILLPFYLALLIALRVGGFQKFDPSWGHDSKKIIGSSYMNIIGYFPQILIVIQVGICVLVDFLFAKYVDKRIQKLLLDQNSFRIQHDKDQQDN